MDDLPLTVTLHSGARQAQETLTYDPDSRLTHVGTSGPGGVSNPLSGSFDYGYNGAGWTTAYTTTVNGAVTATQLAHDDLGRLVQWTGQLHGPESWAYDANGNVVSNTEFISDAFRTTVYTYSGSIPNEVLLSQQTRGLGSEYRTYDAQGDTTSLTSTDPLTSPFYKMAISSNGRPGDDPGRPLDGL
jgi:YD repeat-containing protein